MGKCATGVADGLPLDDVASAVEADSSIISSVAKGLPALGELPALQTGTISGPPSTISSIISSVTRGLPALGELDPCADELGLAILEISTITMTHLTEWMTHNPRIKMLLSPGAAVILAGPRRLFAVDSLARMEAPRPSLAG